ncbi:putative SEC-C motif domain protein [Bradyrhizobium sp. ORS 375]|uniref:YchJ family protein n=1 Tax=Bradyrhizobium sp. (strain ORS 375) TaxID=566679 RepID=UPI0002406F6E|nr:YchJ family protein [Bradyrhizobium sp. ORS 375]CCD95128.1 putative SEC-C motif domain protein [Bradyrhizobium sp. ORS 375]
MPCPCGSGLPLDRCCGPYLLGDALPPTAEALMRSRYTAYTRSDIGYIAATLAADQRAAFDPVAAEGWAARATWLGLRIVSTARGTESDADGVVSFVATYREGGKTIEHHEVSQFRRDAEGAWRFVEGDTRAVVTEPKRAVGAAKVGRNDPCPCGSGKKHKFCCGR